MQNQVRFNGVRKRFRRRPGRLWCRARSGSTGSVKGSGEGLGGFGAEPGQVQQGSGEGSGEGSGRLWCRARSGSTFRRRFQRRSGRLWSTLRCFQRLASQHASEKIVKIERCGCWGYHRSFLHIHEYVQKSILKQQVLIQ